MAIVSFFQTELFGGTINTSASFSKQQNFGVPLTLWSSPYLQSFGVSDGGGVDLFISQFKDNTGTKNVKFRPGLFATQCTSVTFAMSTTDCVVSVALTTMIFG